MMNITRKFFTLFIVIALALSGCKSPQTYREDADKTAYDIIKKTEKDLFHRESVFTIEKPEDALRRRIMEAQGLQYTYDGSLGIENLEKPEHWPEENFPPAADKIDNLNKYKEQLVLSLNDALMIAAKNSFDYQSRKEEVFTAALNLDLAENFFRTTLDGSVSDTITADATAGEDPSGSDVEVTNSTSAGLSANKQLKNGARLSAGIGLSIVEMLTFGNVSTKGMSADASVSIPLLRGSGEHIVLENLTQAQRDLVYAIYEFERYKKTFAVSVAREYFGILEDYNQIANSKANYESVKLSAGKSRKLAETGRMSSVDRDQAVQQELNARNRWINSQQTYKANLDRFKVTLSLPPDADLELDKGELEKLLEYTGSSLSINLKPDLKTPVEFKDIPGPYELDENQAINLALKNRLDLRVSQGRVYDSQRDVIVRADRLRAEVTLGGSASISDGTTKSIDEIKLDFDNSQYQSFLTIDLPLERTSERNAYRNSYISLDRSIRSLQNLEDRIKMDIRDQLRSMQRQRSSLQIESESIRLAENRVRSTKMLLDDGRAEMRDFLEAENDLLGAKNSITSSIVNYRMTELEFQRDLGLLKIDNNGLWVEFDPKNIKTDQTAKATKNKSEGA